MWISYEQLEYLRAIHDAGSITAASENLHRAKSAVYYAVKKLEEQVGFKVVQTDAYRGTLTPKGEQLLLKALPILSQLEVLREDVHRIATGVEMKVSVSTSALFDLKMFNKAIAHIQNKYPDTEITIHREMLSGAKMLKRGIVDIAILEDKKGLEGFEFKQVDEIDMILVIAATHPFLKLPKKDQTEENLFKYPQVIQRSTIKDDDQRGVYERSRRWTVSDLSSKRQIIVDGLGWGRMPRHEIKQELKSKKLVGLQQIEETMKLPIYIGRQLGIEHGKVVEELWKSF